MACRCNEFNANYCLRRCWYKKSTQLFCLCRPTVSLHQGQDNRNEHEHNYVPCNAKVYRRAKFVCHSTNIVRYTYYYHSSGSASACNGLYYDLNSSCYCLLSTRLRPLLVSSRGSQKYCLTSLLNLWRASNRPTSFVLAPKARWENRLVARQHTLRVSFTTCSCDHHSKRRLPEASFIELAKLAKLAAAT